MAKDQNQQPQFQFLVCPKCDGQGRIEKKVCLDCQGFGMAGWTGNQLLYWGKPINLWQSAQDKAERVVKNIINFALLIFGIAGLIALGYVVLSLINIDQPPWEFYKFHNWQLLVFWLSLITDGYVYYRFQRDLEKIKYIPKREYHATPLSWQPINWSMVKKLKKKQKTDISKYFTADAQQAIIKAWQLTNKYKQLE